MCSVCAVHLHVCRCSLNATSGRCQWHECRRFWFRYGRVTRNCRHAHAQTLRKRPARAAGMAADVQLQQTRLRRGCSKQTCVSVKHRVLHMRRVARTGVGCELAQIACSKRDARRHAFHRAPIATGAGTLPRDELTFAAMPEHAYLLRVCAPPEDEPARERRADFGQCAQRQEARRGPPCVGSVRQRLAIPSLNMQEPAVVGRASRRAY